MLINSALHEGLAGMQQSQKKMHQAAQDIVRAGLPTDASGMNPAAPTGAVPLSDPGVAVDDLNAQQVVEAASETERASAAFSVKSGDLTGALIEQNRQQMIFDASANVVSAVNDNLGRLIDDLS